MRENEKRKEKKREAILEKHPAGLVETLVECSLFIRVNE